MSTEEVQGTVLTIIDEIQNLELTLHAMKEEYVRLTNLYNLGYRYITEDGKPHMGYDNVVNIADRLI